MPALFTTVADGNLALHVGDDPQRVLENRSALASRLGIDSSSLRWMNQVHGNAVVMATSQPPVADGIISLSSGEALAVLVADCVPLLLSDDQAGVIAAVHVGRRGLVNGVALNAVKLMQEQGAIQITGLMGPAICGACYEVPLAMQEEVAQIAPAAKSITREGTPGLDIRAGLAEQLLKVGVRVESDSRCTRESDQLFSYRRNPQCGRFVGVIMKP